MKKFIYGLLSLVVIGITLYFLINTKKEEVSNTTTNNNYDSEYIVYKNSKYGIKFSYPKSWGEVTIKEGNKVCPEEDTYRTSDTLSVFDWEFSFSEIKLPNSDSMIRTGVRIYELDSKNLNDCGDDFLLKLAKKEIDPRVISSVMLQPITIQSGLVGIYTAEASRLNTESRRQYTFFVNKDSRNYVIQPYMSFIPYFDSPELKEMEQEFKGDMMEYIKNGKTAENIQKHIEEFTKMTESLEFFSK